MRQIGCIIIGILIPIYVSKVDLWVSHFLIFLFFSIGLQVFLTVLLQHTLFQTFGADLLLSQRRAMLFQASSMTGILNFKYAFGTKNELLITVVGLIFAISLLFNLTLSIFLISKKQILSPSADTSAPESLPADSAREPESERTSEYWLFDQLKSSIIQFHEERMTPFLIRQKTERNIDDQEDEVI